MSWVIIARAKSVASIGSGGDKVRFSVQLIVRCRDSLPRNFVLMHFPVLTSFFVC